MPADKLYQVLFNRNSLPTKKITMMNRAFCFACWYADKIGVVRTKLIAPFADALPMYICLPFLVLFVNKVYHIFIFSINGWKTFDAIGENGLCYCTNSVYLYIYISLFLCMNHSSYIYRGNNDCMGGANKELLLIQFDSGCRLSK